MGDTGLERSGNPRGIQQPAGQRTPFDARGLTVGGRAHFAATTIDQILEGLDPRERAAVVAEIAGRPGAPKTQPAGSDAVNEASELLEATMRHRPGGRDRRGRRLG
jgi:hypothetical protein